MQAGGRIPCAASYPAASPSSSRGPCCVRFTGVHRRVGIGGSPAGRSRARRAALHPTSGEGSVRRGCSKVEDPHSCRSRNIVGHVFGDAQRVLGASPTANAILVRRLATGRRRPPWSCARSTSLRTCGRTESTSLKTCGRRPHCPPLSHGQPQGHRPLRVQARELSLHPTSQHTLLAQRQSMSGRVGWPSGAASYCFRRQFLLDSLCGLGRTVPTQPRTDSDRLHLGRPAGN